jgi:hypothetical protein
LTTVPSMNTTNDPRIAAASVRRWPAVMDRP